MTAEPSFRRDRRLLLVAALLWACAAAIAFGVEAGWGRAFDRTVLLAIAEPVRAAGWPVAVMLMASVAGSAAVRLPVAAVVTAWLCWRRDARAAAMVAATAIGVLVGNGLLKRLVGRARPDVLEHLAVETSLSFPSGHASNAAALFLALGWVAVRRGARPAVAWAVAVAAAGLVGVSRLVLGVHWPTDVIAGWCVGAGWMVVCAAACGPVRHAR